MKYLFKIFTENKGSSFISDSLLYFCKISGNNYRTGHDVNPLLALKPLSLLCISTSSKDSLFNRLKTSHITASSLK